MKGLAEKGGQRWHWLRFQTPVFGWLVRRFAATCLALRRSQGARKALAEEVALCVDQDLKRWILFLLRWVRDSNSISEICAAWVAGRDPGLGTLIVTQRWNPVVPPEVRVLTALKIDLREALVSNGGEIVKPLLDACGDQDAEIAARARQWIGELTDPGAIDTLCALWAERRDPISAEVVCNRGLIARAPPEIRILTLLKNKQTDSLMAVGASWVDSLAQALFDSDPTIRAGADKVLGSLEDPDARESLCRLVIELGLREYRVIAARAGYLPREAAERALFFFLTEQWERYLELDFDFTLLGAQFERGTAKVRSRIAETARQSGRTEWISAIHGARRNRKLTQLLDDEWDAAITVMAVGKRWKEMWQIAQSAPADWAWRLIDRVRQSDWVPPEASEADLFFRLSSLLDRCERESGFSGRLIRSARVVGRHASRITCMELMPDGRTVGAGTEDHTATLWDVPDEKPPKALQGHSDWILAIAASPDGRITASGSADGTVRLWNTGTGELKGILKGHTGEVRCLGFSRDGSVVISGGGDKSIRFWRVADSALLETLTGHVDDVNCLAVSPDGKMLATGSYDNEIRLWSFPGGALISVLKGHRAMVNCLMFDPSRERLISGGKDRNVILWQVPEGTLLRRLKGHREDVSCLAVSPDGNTVASGSWDTTIRLWRLADGELIDTLGRAQTNDGHSSWVTCLTYSPDGKILASGGCDHTVRLWSAPGGAPLRVLEGHHDRVIAVRFTPDSRALISGGWDKAILLWRSELTRLRAIPIEATTVEDLDWVEQTLLNSRLADAEQAWMELLVVLMRWRRRFDIQLEDPVRISVGEFDIELEG